MFFYALMTLPSASSTLSLATQDVQTYFNEISPLLVLLGVGIAVTMLGILVYVLKEGFAAVGAMFGYKRYQYWEDHGGVGEPEDYRGLKGWRNPYT